MDTVRINPLIVSVSPTDHTLISPIQPTVHKGGIGKLISVVAMVAIPMAAPAIASSIAASGVLGASITAAMTTTVGGVISGAIAGAALGGITAAVTGQSISAGALGGAIGGGIGGYAQGVSAGTGAVGTGPAATAASGGAGLDTGIATTYDAAGNVVGTQSISQAGVVGASQAPQGALAKALSDTSELVASKVDAKALANLTMQAAGSLMGEVLVPPGTLAELSPQEQELLEERKVELAALRDRDLEAYNQAIEISKAYMVQAGQIDPTYFANQELAKSKIGSARTIRNIDEQAALDDKTISGNETRRLGIDANRLSASAYDTGYIKGLDTKGSLIKQASDTMPTASQTVNYSAGLAGLQDTYKGQREAADKERENYQMMFAGLNTKEGNTDEERDRKAKLYDGMSSYMQGIT